VHALPIVPIVPVASGTHGGVAPVPPVGATPHRGRRALVAVAVLVGFLGGSIGSVAVLSAIHSDRAPVVAVAPTATRPASPTATTTPSASPASTPSTGSTSSNGSSGSSSPTATTPAPDATTDTTHHTLTTGLVNINTVLGLQHGEAAGTGIVLTATGDVITNNHVVDGATKITVTVVDTGASYTATVVGTDPAHDIAVVRVDATGLAVAPLGASTAVQVGDAVVAIGNAGGTGTPTTADGEVTALDQTVTATDENGGNAETLHGLIQVTAALQPGDSGGPLYDAAGKVVGIDAIGSTGGFRRRTTSGGGYAIPIDAAVEIASRIQSGTPSPGITLGYPAFLGIQAAPSDGGGVSVITTFDGLPATAIGLQAGDVIVGVDDAKVSTNADLTTALTSHHPGDQVTIHWTRNGVAQSAVAALAVGPAN
jgi:S1-C subfamily serine protease